MNRIAAVAAAVLLAATLTGCSAATSDAQPRSFAQTAQGQPDTTESPEPLVAETPAEISPDDAEAAYLKFLADHPRKGTIIPNATDEQRLAAGYEICKRLAAGEEGTDITVIEGEQRAPESGYYLDSFDMLSAASSSGLCG
jgi:hypothetical protein